MKLQFKNRNWLYLIFMTIFFGFLFSDEKLTAEYIIQNVEKLFRGSSSHGIFELKIQTQDWHRSIKMESWAEGTEKSFIRILSPKKEKGIGFLKVGNEMWQYLPKVRRTIKIPPSMMLASWMGSDFTNDDLARESSLLKDYSHKLIEMTELDGISVYQLELVPKTDAAVVWDKILLKCSTDFIPLQEEYFDESGQLVRTIKFSDIKIMGDRKIPTRISLTTTDEPLRITELIYHEIEFDLSIPEKIFTLNNLKK